MPSQQQPKAEAQAEEMRQRNMSTLVKPNEDYRDYIKRLRLDDNHDNWEYWANPDNTQPSPAAVEQATQPQPPQGETFRDSHIRALEKQVIEYCMERDELRERNSNLQAVVKIRERQRDALQAQRDDLLRELQRMLKRNPTCPEAQSAYAAIARATSKQGLGGSDAESIQLSELI